MHASPDVSWTHLPSHRPISCGFEERSRHLYEGRNAHTLDRPVRRDVIHAGNCQGMVDKGKSLSSNSAACKHVALPISDGLKCDNRERNACGESSSDWVNLCALPMGRSPSAQMYEGISNPKPPPYSIISYSNSQTLDSNEEEETSF